MNESKPQLRYRIIDYTAATIGVVLVVFGVLFLLGFFAALFSTWLHLGWRFGSWLYGL